MREILRCNMRSCAIKCHKIEGTRCFVSQFSIRFPFAFPVSRKTAQRACWHVTSVRVCIAHGGVPFARTNGQRNGVVLGPQGESVPIAMVTVLSRARPRPRPSVNATPIVRLRAAPRALGPLRARSVDSGAHERGQPVGSGGRTVLGATSLISHVVATVGVSTCVACANARTHASRARLRRHLCVVRPRSRVIPGDCVISSVVVARGYRRRSESASAETERVFPHRVCFAPRHTAPEGKYLCPTRRVLFLFFLPLFAPAVSSARFAFPAQAREVSHGRRPARRRQR